MARRHLSPLNAEAADLRQSLVRGEKDLDIFEAHAEELFEVESGIQLNMKRKDRAYKETHFHSIPKPIKHIRP